MTLIASYITKYGIIQASDSNLTDDRGNAGFGQKIFPIPYLNASLPYSGSYTINSKELDIWIGDFIAALFFTCKSIEEFCKELSSSLDREMREHEFKLGTIIHVAGYSTHNNKSYVEHWHISNIGLDPSNGSYTEPVQKFHPNEDFNSRKVENHRRALKEIDNDPLNHIWYVNGFPPGRISAVIIKQSIDEAMLRIWSNPDWKFSVPKNLFDFSSIVKLYFDFVSRLFTMSNYSALFIGGEIQTYLISAPQNVDME